LRLGWLIVAALAQGAAAAEAFVTNQGSDDLSVVDLATGAVTATIPIGGKPAGVAVAPDGRVWITSPDSATLSMYDPETGALVRVVLAGGPLGIAVNPVSGAVYVADWYGDRLFVVEDGAAAGEIPTGRSPSGVAVAPDGARILTADRDSDQVSVFDAATRARLAAIPSGYSPTSSVASTARLSTSNTVTLSP